MEISKLMKLMSRMKMPDQRVIRASLRASADALHPHAGEVIESRVIEGIDQLPRMYLARGSSGQLMVLTPCQRDLMAKRDFMRTFVHTMNFKSDPEAPPTTMLVAECRDTQYESEFLDLLSAVFSTISAFGAEADFGGQVFQTIVDWAELFERSNGKDLTLQEAVGVWAELRATQRVVTLTGDVSLSFWLGPRGLPHDIVVNDRALEVKGVTTAVISKITINGMNQLNPSPSRDLHIAVFQVRDEAGTTSVSDMFEKLVEMGVDRLRLMELILDEGMSQSSTWWDHKLSLFGEELFVVDEGFPRITPSLIQADFELTLIESMKYTVQIGGLPRLTVSDPVGRWLEIVGN
jgi:Putative  PD-(D/E)XK family member, (DUF4420)